jgi:hypothetical protein
MTDPVFDTPDSLPGYNMDPGVLGAYASPEGGGPVIDTIEQRANQASGTAALGHAMDFRGAMSGDNISAELPAAQTSQFEHSMTGLAGGLQNSTENLSGLSAYLPASVPGVGGQPDTTAAPNPAGYQMDPTSAGYSGPMVPSMVPNYSTGGIPDPTAPASMPGGAPMPSPGGGIGPAGAAGPGGQLPGAGPMDSSGAPPGAGAPTGAGPANMPGYLAYTVPWATDSLTSAVAAAAAGAGPQAATVAGTVSLSGGTVRAGGGGVAGSGGATASIMALGSEGGGAHFTGSSPGWFDAAVQGWIAANPPPPPPPPPGAPGTGMPTGPAPPADAGQAPMMTGMPPPDMIPGAGGQMDQSSPMYSGPMLGGPPDPATTNQTVGGAVMGKLDQAINAFDKAPGDTTGPTPGVWDNMGSGILTHQDVLQQQAQALAQGGQGWLNRGTTGDIFAGYKEETSGQITYDNPQDAAFVADAMRSMGADPTGKFTTAEEANAEENIDPVTHEPNMDPSDIWSSPLGGISNVQTDAEAGNATTPASSWRNRMMTL